MEITEIRLNLRDDDKLKAFVNITFDHAFVVRGLKIIHGNKGLFISMPSRRRRDGTYQDIAHPINLEMRRQLEQMIMEAYEKEIEKKNSRTDPIPEA